LKNIDNSRSSLQRGFSLLEILVAFSILAIFLGVLLNIFSGGLRGVELTAQHARATQLAEQVLTLAGREIPLVPGAMEGADDEYHWRIAIEPYYPPLADWQPDQVPFQLYRVSVLITWGDWPRVRQFALNSLRLAPAETGQQAGNG
jgi:general secretion pathway protein I